MYQERIGHLADFDVFNSQSPNHSEASYPHFETSPQKAKLVKVGIETSKYH